MADVITEDMQAADARGLGERLLKELIKSPKFKASLKILVSELDPESARGVIKTFIWEDVETFMGTMAVLPTAVNYSMQALHEVVVQLNTFPPAILLAFLNQLVDKVDFKQMEETIVEFKALLEKLNPVIENLKAASSGVAGQLSTAE